MGIWWYNRIRRPAVDLDAFGDAWTDRVRAAYRRMRRDLWILDVTSDLGVPVMVALSRRTDKPCEDIMLGFGAHLDPRVAVRRALTELNQLLPPLVDIGPDDGYRCTDPDAVRWWRHATVANQPYLLPDPAAGARIPSDYPYVPTNDLDLDLRDVRDRLERAGLELLVLDLTRPDLDLPVVKVVVPGLRHFWARYAPGRLYDVPVRTGARADPTPYPDLNPIPLFV